MKSKVFLGGTCGTSVWRNKLIPLLEENNIHYFNPVVKNWTSQCRAIEEYEKDNLCNIHLYVITKEMKGVYSIAEFMASCLSGKNTIFVVVNDGFDKSQIKSLMATTELARKHTEGRNLITHFQSEDEGFDTIVEMIKFLNKTK